MVKKVTENESVKSVKVDDLLKVKSTLSKKAEKGSEKSKSEKKEKKEKKGEKKDKSAKKEKDEKKSKKSEKVDKEKTSEKSDKDSTEVEKDLKSKVKKDNKEKENESNGESRKRKKTESDDKRDDKKAKTEEKKVLEVPKSPPSASQAGPLISLFRVSTESIQALAAKSITHFFPIQEKTYDLIFDGKDVLGRARTGTGKTLSFALPLVEKLLAKYKENKTLSYGRKPRIIALAPTRELAQQVARDFEVISGPLAVKCIYGGSSPESTYAVQERALRNGFDILIGTPGRVIDHLERKTLVLDDIEFIVLDEADEMLSMGFSDSVEKILSSIPQEKDRQTLLFSATIPQWVKGIAKKWMKPTSVTVDLIGNQKLKAATLVKHLAINCSYQQRQETIGDIVKVYGKTGRTIIFADTKAEANDIAVNSSLRSDCQVLHGDIVQSQRELTLAGFRDGKFNTLVATDVAARGLDIEGVDLVIQCQPPQGTETYIHRSGRTGRAGREGTCCTFFTSSQAFLIRMMELKAGIKFERIGAPQANDLVGIASENAVKQLSSVHPSNTAIFMKSAQELLATKSGEDLVASALAFIAGYVGELKKKSLLASMSGHTTLYIGGQPIYSPRYVINFLQRFDEKVQVKGIRFCKDGGVVADVPSELAEKILASKNLWGNLQITEPSALPELKEDPREESPALNLRSGRFGGPSRGRGGRGGSFRGSSRAGSYRGSSGGRGRSSR